MRCVFILFIFISLPVFAENICEESFSQTLNTSVQTGQFSDGTCFISVRPSNPTDMKYRNHIFTDRGQWLIFNSFDGENNFDSTGGRVLFLPPRQSTEFHYSIVDEILVLSPFAEETFHFNLLSTKLESYLQGNIVMDAKVHRDNEGGLVELTSRLGIFDMGFQFSGVPQKNPERVSNWTINNTLCGIKNRDLFDYSDPEEPRWKIVSPSLLTQVLQKYDCPTSR